MASQPETEVREEEEIIQFLLHSSLLYLDYSSIAVNIGVILGSVVVFSVIIISSACTSSIFQVYRSLSLKEKIFWNLSIVRGVFGAFATIVGAWSIFATTNLKRDMIFGLTATSSFSMAVTSGFFLFECLALTLSDWYQNQLSRLLHLHHWICLLTGCVITFGQSGYLMATHCLALEMSTPFSAVCWMMLKAGLGSSRVWMINQMVLLHTFHLRSVIECYLWYLYYSRWDIIWSTQPWPSFLVMMCTLIMFSFLATPYWCYKKTLQMGQRTDWNFEENQQPANGNVKNGHACKVD